MASQQQQPTCDGSTFAGMPKAQLYDIMSQMKAFMDQNQQQARQILIDNPLLTRALFHAQIILGMVQPPKVMPNIQAVSKAQVEQTSNAQSSQTRLAHVGTHGEPSSSQALLSTRPKQPAQASISPSASVPQLNLPAVSAPQSKGFPSMQVPPVAPPQTSQTQNLSLPTPAPPNYSARPSHIPLVSVQPHQPLQDPGLINQVLQPPLPLQPRPAAVQSFTNQLQLHTTVGFQPSNLPQQPIQQPLFLSGIAPQNSFIQGRPPLQNQPPPQHLFQAGSHVNLDYGNQGGNPMQSDRGGIWHPGSPELAKTRSQARGPPPVLSRRMTTSSSGQPPRPASLTPDMEKALLQQVMSLTPEQINLLPPEQRNQVLQLQEMLR